MSRLSPMRGRSAPGRAEDRHGAIVRLEQRNAELEALVASLEARNASLEGFAAMAAHQLSEPLIVAESSAIMVSEDLDGGLDPHLRGRLDAIGTAAARGRRHMDALLLDARCADRPLELADVDVGEVVGEVLDLLEPRIAKRRATVDVGRMPVARSHRTLLVVVFENLLANALKYGPRADGRVGVRAERDAGGWRFSVASEGAPIPPNEAAVLFEPFRRGTGERRSPGHGLGLAICGRVVARLGGSIGVAPGARGNTFHFSVPATD